MATSHFERRPRRAPPPVNLLRPTSQRSPFVFTSLIPSHICPSGFYTTTTEVFIRVP
ncbi:hypothetical protein EGR_03797 [Echinococcus granulosus]|uniref:Uncharacterized protein n=1 Tax=Echinococcus granulosus TaxID=6210 RepID=W6UJK1_ECHGR|nr:hypothetical protein EGR_03797 [Echinococcus granulosus]EUB61311.1 hypothetical protein EGR_03797 [Echinococcus granulosus]